MASRVKWFITLDIRLVVFVSFPIHSFVIHYRGSYRSLYSLWLCSLNHCLFRASGWLAHFQTDAHRRGYLFWHSPILVTLCWIPSLWLFDHLTRISAHWITLNPTCSLLKWLYPSIVNSRSLILVAVVLHRDFSEILESLNKTVCFANMALHHQVLRLGRHYSEKYH